MLILIEVGRHPTSGCSFHARVTSPRGFYANGNGRTAQDARIAAEANALRALARVLESTDPKLLPEWDHAVTFEWAGSEVSA